MPSGFSARRALWYFLLLALPFNVIPIFNGLFEGVIFAGMLVRTNSANVANVGKNLQRAFLLQDLSGMYASNVDTPRMTEVAYPPYHVIHLLDPVNWWAALGLTRFDADFELYPDGGYARVVDWAKLDALYLERSRAGGDHDKWHHWVYASANELHVDGNFVDGWDQAFNQLLVHHNAAPAAHNASFSFIACKGDFLCGEWLVTGPALIHFTTELAGDVDEEGEVEYHYGYKRVYTRVIEFPRDGHEKELYLPPGSFPSPFNQLISVTGNPNAWREEPIHSFLEQAYRRFDDAVWEARRDQPLTFGRTVDLEDKMIAALGLSPHSWWPAVVVQIAAGLSFLPAFLIPMCYGWASRVLHEALDWRAEIIYSEPDESSAEAKMICAYQKFVKDWENYM
jgi:hypothetical protein